MTMQGSTMNDFNPTEIKEMMKASDDEKEQAFKICREYADKGNRDAMGLLGYMYRDGIGVGKNLNLAIDWMNKSYELKAPFARLELATMLLERLKNDYNIALQLLENESKKGNSKAFTILAKLYRDGVGCSKDYEQYLAYMRLAYESGSKDAGWVVVKELKNDSSYSSKIKAFELCHKLANEGDYRAMGLLGEMYRDGVGCKADKKLAIEYLKRAGDNGIEWAKKDLRKMIKE